MTVSPFRRGVLLGLVCAAGVWASSAWLQAQGAVAVTPVPAKVYTGTDVGFRVKGMRGPSPTGTLVVKIDGAWVDVDFADGIRRLSQ